MTHSALQRLDHHFQAMPPVAAMGLSIAFYDGNRLQLHAPLARHVNDKGCAFGGSMSSIMTLAAWGLTTLRIEAAGLSADVFVASSTVRYLAPLWADIDVYAELAGASDWAVFMDTLRERGRASAHLVAWVALPNGDIASQLTARYVAILRS